MGGVIHQRPKTGDCHVVLSGSLARRDDVHQILLRFKCDPENGGLNVVRFNVHGLSTKRLTQLKRLLEEFGIFVEG